MWVFVFATPYRPPLKGGREEDLIAPSLRRRGVGRLVNELQIFNQHSQQAHCFIFSLDLMCQLSIANLVE